MGILSRTYYSWLVALALAVSASLGTCRSYFLKAHLHGQHFIGGRFKTGREQDQ